MKNCHSYIRLLILTLLLMPSTALIAQRQTIKNLPYYDQRLLHWGFSLGVNAPDITFTHSGNEAGEGWWATCPNVNPAFFVGLMGDVAITEHLNFRVTPMLYFQERGITFERTVHDGGLIVNDGEQAVANGERQRTTQQLKTTYLEIPASLKISTRRINNYRPYLVAGLQADIDMTREKETPIVFRRFDLGLHFGMGCDIYLPFFKLAPELRFNLGLMDMIDHKRTGLQDQSMMPYTEAILSARNTGMSLIFWFE